MQTVTIKATAKIVAVATGLAMATSMLSLAPIAHAASLTSTQISSILALLSSFGANSATIANVQAALNGQPTTGTGGTVTSSCSFTKDLTLKSSGSDVTCLQQALIAGGYSITAGATGYFGAQTQTAVIAWQKAAGVTPAAGYFGAKSRGAFNLGGSTTGGTTGGTVYTGTGNGLKVSLATDSPNNIALVQSQSAGDLAHFMFANPTSVDIKVTSLTMKRIGVSVDSALSNIYLFVGAARITDPAGISASTFSFNDSTGLFTVPAGSVKTVSVRADIAASTNGQQIGVQLTSVSSSGTLDSSVSLPITGFTQSVSGATIAGTSFGAVSIPKDLTVSPGNDITLFQSTVTVATRAALLKSITFENRGSTVDADFQNLKLLVKGVQVGSTVAATTNKKVSFDFSANPIRIETGNAQFRLVGDVVGGSGDTVDFQIRRAVDAQFIDADLMQAEVVTGTLSGTADTIEGVDLSVTKANNSPSSGIALDASSVKLASFEFRAIGDDLKIEQMTVDTDIVGTADDLANGKVFLNGVQVGSTQDILESGATKFTFGSQMVLVRGTTAIVDIYADAKQANDSSFVTGTTVDIGVSIATADTEGVKSGNRLGTAVSIVRGNILTITTSLLTASKVGSYSNQSVVKGTNNFKLGSFTLLAGANEGVNINTIAIAFAAAESSTLTNLRIVNVSTGAAFGSTKASIAGAAADNSFSGNINIAASASATFDVYADVKSSANVGPILATSVSVATGGSGLVTGNTVVIAPAVTLQTMTVVAGGTLTAAVNTGGTPANAIVVGGTTGMKIGSFSFLAANSDVTINKLIVKVPANSASAVSLITLKNATTGLTLKAQGFDLTASGLLLFSTSTFSGLGFVVPAGTSRAIDVYVDVAPITTNNSNLSGQAIYVNIDTNEGVEYADGANNLTTSLTGTPTDMSSAGTGVGTMYVRKSVPTLSTDGTSATSFAAINANASNVDVGRFTITADANGDIDWGKIVFNVTKSPAVLLDATTTIKVYDVTNNGHTLVNGTFATTTAQSIVEGAQMFLSTATSGIIDFRPTAVQTVTAGHSKTYQVETTIGGLATTLSVSLSIAGPSTSVNAVNNLSSVAGAIGTALSTSYPSFVWSDWSDSTTHFTNPTGATDWINDYLVKTTNLTIGTRAEP